MANIKVIVEDIDRKNTPSPTVVTPTTPTVNGDGSTFLEISGEC